MSPNGAVLPMQFGLPGAIELLIVLVIVGLVIVVPLAVGYWIATDARRRGSDHPVAWGAMAFLSGLAYLLGLVVFVAFYLIVREDLGEPVDG